MNETAVARKPYPLYIACGQESIEHGFGRFVSGRICALAYRRKTGDVQRTKAIATATNPKMIPARRFAFLPGVAAAWVRDNRSEERRVGKECRSRWSPY